MDSGMLVQRAYCFDIQHCQGVSFAYPKVVVIIASNLMRILVQCPFLG